MLSPDQVEGHWAYRLTSWLLAHGAELLMPAVVICVFVAILGTAYLWFFQGARIIAAAWVWRRAGAWWRTGRTGSTRSHSPEYEAVLQSPGWRRRRSEAIRAAGRRCQECGAAGPLDVHHLSYAHLGNERPDELLAVCEDCHGRLHRRSAG